MSSFLRFSASPLALNSCGAWWQTLAGRWEQQWLSVNSLHQQTQNAHTHSSKFVFLGVMITKSWYRYRHSCRVLCGTVLKGKQTKMRVTTPGPGQQTRLTCFSTGSVKEATVRVHSGEPSPVDRPRAPESRKGLMRLRGLSNQGFESSVISIHCHRN